MSPAACGTGILAGVSWGQECLKYDFGLLAVLSGAGKNAGPT
jgi:hypothetical protein